MIPRRLPVLSASERAGPRSGASSGAAAQPAPACTRCGACCVAPDIAALDKPLGRPCIHLGDDDLCTIYERRPDVCRSYQPDALCADVAAPTRAERVQRYLAAFGLEAEAAEAVHAPSMRAAREAREPIC